MDHRSLCRSLLSLADSIPSTMQWGVTDIGQGGILFVHDAREESTTLIMEAIAERFGDIIATESISSRRLDAGPILGCLIRVKGDVDEITGRVREAERAQSWESIAKASEREWRMRPV